MEQLTDTDLSGMFDSKLLELKALQYKIQGAQTATLELQNEENRLKGLLPGLTSEVEGWNQKIADRKLELANIQAQIDEKLAAADAQIAGSRAALLEREKKLEAGEGSLDSEKAVVASAQAKADSTLAKAKALTDKLRTAFAAVKEDVGGIHQSLSDQIDKILEG